MRSSSIPTICSSSLSLAGRPVVAVDPGEPADRPKFPVKHQGEEQPIQPAEGQHPAVLAPGEAPQIKGPVEAPDGKAKGAEVQLDRPEAGTLPLSL